MLCQYRVRHALITKGESPLRALRFKQIRKSRDYDLLWSGWSDVLLVSSRLVSVLESEGASGWRTYQVRLASKSRVPWRGYSGLAITGRAGPVQWKRSERVWRPPPVPHGSGHWRLRGLWFDVKTWDGSDLFLLKDGGIMATDRIVRAMRRAKLKGIEFFRQSEYEIRESTALGR